MTLDEKKDLIGNAHSLSILFRFSIKFTVSCLAANVPGSYDYILVNDDLDQTYEEFKSIINKVSVLVW